MPGRRWRNVLALGGLSALSFGIAALLASAWVRHAETQEAQAEAARLREEGNQHWLAYRFEESAESYRQMHAVMQSAGLPRASDALYFLGDSLSQMLDPEHQREAREVTERYLRETEGLDSDPEVREFRLCARLCISRVDGYFQRHEHAQAQVQAVAPIDSAQSATGPEQAFATAEPASPPSPPQESLPTPVAGSRAHREALGPAVQSQRPERPPSVRQGRPQTTQQNLGL